MKKGETRSEAARESLKATGGTAPWKVSMERSDTTEIFSSKALEMSI